MTMNDQLKAAYAAYSKGDMAAARRHGEAAVRLQPGHIGTLQLLGVVLSQTGDPAAGAAYLRRVLDADGGDTADNRINLAKALIDAGQLDAAAQICSNNLWTESKELQQMQAQILKAQGRATEASWSYERLVAENPDDFDSWNNLGNARHDQGDLDGALAAFQRAQQLNPQSSLVHTNIGRVMLSKDQYEEACLVLEKAALLAPKDPAPLLELGQTLTNIDHAEAGLRALGTAARLDPRNPRIFVAIGIAFTELSNHAQAERSFRFALQADPGCVPAYLNLGIILEKNNRLDDLAALIDQAAAGKVQSDEIDYLRALLLGRQGDLAGALALARTARPKALSPSMIAQFVGQTADRLNDIEQAFYAFEDMNRAASQSPLGISKDRSAYARGIDRLSAQTTAVWYAGWPAAPVADDHPTPAFLVGFPRSGTTLLDTILMGHSGVHVLEEIPIIETIANQLGDLDRVGEMGASDVTAMRALYFSELAKASPAPPGQLIIDKNPLSMIRIPLIHRMFPAAKIILAMRHPCDVVLSCYMQNFKPTEAMSSFLDLANASRAYDRIFAYWESCRAIFPINVHMLRYEAMVADTEAEMRPLFDFLGLAWEEAVLDHQKTAKDRGYIRTPSYAQVTEKIYSSASGRWKRYESQMTEVLPILEPWVTHFGYSLD